MFSRLAPCAILVSGLLLVVGCAGPNAAELGGSDSGFSPLVNSSSTPDRSSSSPSASPSPSSTSDTSESEDSKGAVAPEEPLLRVEVYEVRPKVVQEAIVATGELRADEEVDLRAEESGRVVKLSFREGQKVKAGDLLVKINDEDLVAERRRLEVQKDLAQTREQRSKTLFDEGTLSQDRYDEANGRLLVLKAQLAQIDAEIRKTEIRAPFSGVIGLREVSEGSYLTSATSIARLQNLDPIKLDFAIPEKYVGSIARGDSVEFTVAGQARTFSGKVYAVEPRIDAATRTVRVRARAANPGGELFPGAFAKVRLVLAEQDDALMVPAIALVPGLEATTVYVVESGSGGDVVSPRAVEIGRRTEDRVQILSGLEAGDRVVVSGVQQVRPGLAVEARLQERAR